jgi:hypothetical protein
MNRWASGAKKIAIMSRKMMGYWRKASKPESRV